MLIQFVNSYINWGVQNPTIIKDHTHMEKFTLFIVKKGQVSFFCLMEKIDIDP